MLVRARAWPELAGALLVAVAVGWTFIAAGSSGGAPAPIASLLGAIVAAAVAGRVLGSLHRSLAPALVVATGLALIARDPHDVFSRVPLGGPFGYSNATAGWFAIAAFAALMVATSAGNRAMACAAAGAAVAFAAVPPASGSVAAGALFAALALPVLFVRRGTPSRAAVAGLAIVLLAGISWTVVVGARRDAGPAGAALTERRVMLWGDAFELMRRHLLTGVGPGRFEAVGRTALADRDARWAHNAFLQQGAEMGVPGLALTVLIFLAAIAIPGSGRAPDRTTALCAAAIAALGLQACTDYVLHFAALPVTVALLFGSETSQR